MAGPNTREFTDSNFDAEVLRSPVPVLVDFWAEWCQPCRMLAPVIDAVADEVGSKAKVGKVDIDAGDNRNIAVKYAVNSIPTVILFKNGEPAKRWVGIRKGAEFISAISEG